MVHRFLGFLAWVACATSVKMHSQLKVNPVRRVISMLQMMEKKVTEEGETEKELFDKVMCLCETTERTLAKSISAAETKIPQLESESQAKEAEKAQLTNDIAQASKDQAAAQKSMAEAKGIREKEAASAKGELESDAASVTAMQSALAALRKGTSGAFLQTSGAALLRHVVASADLPEWDRQTVTAYLSMGQSDGNQDYHEEGYEPESDDVIGVVSQLKESTEKDIVEAKAAEKKSLEDYDSLVIARTKEVSALNKELESKRARLGEVGVELVNTAQDRTDTTTQLAKDKKLLSELKKDCKTKAAEQEERSSTRAQEMIALADTIKLLNDDQAATLFKKSLPSASLLQVQVTSHELLQEARQVLTAPAARLPRDPRVSLIAMTMRGRKVNFGKVVTMIDKMIDLLGKEQKDDDEKKTYCREEFDKAEDEKKSLEQSISDGKKTVANAKEMVATLTDEIAKIAAGLDEMDKAVAEATKQRKSENKAYVEELAANNAAVEILGIAKNRLNKFYNPKLASLRQKDAVAKGGTPAQREPPDRGAAGNGVVAEAFSFLQASSGQREARSPSLVETQKEGASGVLAMIGTITRDIQKQITEMKVQEKESQVEYEQFMKESSAKRAADAKGISAKEAAKAEAEAKTQKHGQEVKSATAEAMANAEYLHGLHVECDWFMKNHGVRQEARTSEISALKQAKAVLSGADYSFLQVREEKYNLRRNSRP